MHRRLPSSSVLRRGMMLSAGMGLLTPIFSPSSLQGWGGTAVRRSSDNVGSSAPAQQTPSAVAGEFRRFCAAQNVSTKIGAPLSSFLGHLQDTMLLPADVADRIIRESTDVFAFTDDGRRLSLLVDSSAAVGTTGGASSPRRVVDEKVVANFARLADSMPHHGVRSREAQALFANLKLKLTNVGAITLRDALSLFPTLFDVIDDFDGDGDWLVKPKERTTPPAVVAETTSVQPGGATPLAAKAAAAQATPFEQAVRRALIAHHARQVRRVASPSSSEWVDLDELIAAYRHVAPLELADKSSEALRQAVMASTGTVLEFEPRLFLRLRRPARGAYLFVDASYLAPGDVQAFMQRLSLDANLSTIIVARPPTATAHGDQDRLTPYGVSPYMLLEAEAMRVQQSAPNGIVLKDIVYCCSDSQEASYVEYVARAVPFLDANVYVVSPRSQHLVSSWKADP